MGRITTDGRLREFQSGISPGANPSRITSGPDGALWFTELDNDRIARVTLTGRITEYFVGRGSRPWGITSGPDKRIWFAAGAGNQVVRFTPPDLPGVAGTLTYDYAFTGSRTRFTSMRVAGLPRGTRLTARCRGGGCPRGTFVRRNERSANLSKRFRSPLAPGARIEVRVTRSGESPKLFLFRINRAGTKPTFKVRCRPKGAKSPRRCCAERGPRAPWYPPFARVWIVYDCLFPWTIGGGERWLRRLAEYLAERDIEVTYLTRRQWSDEDAPALPGIRVVAVSPDESLYGDDGRRGTGQALRFGRGVMGHLLRNRSRYDVVHCSAFPYFSLLAARLALGGSRTRLFADWLEVWSSSYWREYLGVTRGWIGRTVQQACVRASPRAFAISPMTARRLRTAGMRGPIITLPGLYSTEHRPKLPPRTSGTLPRSCSPGGTSLRSGCICCPPRWRWPRHGSHDSAPGSSGMGPSVPGSRVRSGASASRTASTHPDSSPRPSCRRRCVRPCAACCRHAGRGTA